jgi:hypothetical protein
METKMQYKTIVLELLQQNSEIHHQLLSKRTLLPTLELYARELKTSHEAWKDRLFRAMPSSNQSQIASEALEIALWELENFLHSEFPPEDGEPLSVEGAMAFILDHSPPA